MLLSSFHISVCMAQRDKHEMMKIRCDVLMMEKSVFLGANIKLFCFLFTPRFVVVISFEFVGGEMIKRRLNVLP